MSKIQFGHNLLFVLLIATPCGLAADDPIERWATAAGGREKVAAIKAVYREATVEFGIYKGAIKVWHTANGK